MNTSYPIEVGDDNEWCSEKLEVENLTKYTGTNNPCKGVVEAMHRLTTGAYSWEGKTGLWEPLPHPDNYRRSKGRC